MAPLGKLLKLHRRTTCNFVRSLRFADPAHYMPHLMGGAPEVGYRYIRTPAPLTRGPVVHLRRKVAYAFTLPEEGCEFVRCMLAAADHHQLVTHV